VRRIVGSNWSNDSRGVSDHAPNNQNTHLPHRDGLRRTTEWYRFMSALLRTVGLERSGRRAMALLCAFVLVAAPATGTAELVTAYLWADQPQAAKYIPNNAYLRPGGNVPQEITRMGPGNYTVDLGVIVNRPGANVQVTAYGMATGHCKTAGWSGGAARVRCFDAAGRPADLRFTLLVTRAEPGTQGTWYAWAGQPGAANYRAAPNYAFTPGGSAVNVSRSAAGAYRVNFGAPLGAGGDAQVTAYGTGSEYCSIRGWSSSGVDVRCFAASGVPADAAFSLLFAGSNAPASISYAWANNPTTSNYAVDRNYARIRAGAGVTATRSGAGLYRLTFGPDVGAGGNVQVSAYGPGSNRCHVAGWGGGAVNVRCLTADGRPVDNRFTVYVQDGGGSRIPTPRPPVPPRPTPPPPPAPTVTASIDFDRLPDGSAIGDGRLLRFEYRELGITFPDGVVAVRCTNNRPCRRALSAPNAAAPPDVNEFQRRELRIDFTRTVRTFSAHVSLDYSAPQGTEVSIRAFDSGNRIVARNSVRLTGRARIDGEPLSITSLGGFRRVELSAGVPGQSPHNFFFVDSLGLDTGGGPVTGPDTDPPVVDIVSPAAGTVVDRQQTPIRVQIRDDESLALVDLQVEHESGERSVSFSGGNVCGRATPCPDRAYETDVPVTLTREGTSTVLFRACDRAGNCASESTTLVLSSARDVDVWVMGIEYNQQWQDVIYTDLHNDGSEAGRVPLRHPTGRDSELAEPIVPGKPMVVRVYTGLRNTPEAPADGVMVTGTLTVDTGVVGASPRTIRPLETNECFDHRNVYLDSCQSRVRVYPSLGRLGYQTNTDYDLDLVAQRIAWDGTLNFVVPAEVTRLAVGSNRGGTGLNLRVNVRPADRTFRETNPADNRFELQLQNVQQRRMDLRVVRVRLPGMPAPTERDVRRALADMHTMIPYSRIRVVEQTEIFHRPATTRLDLDVLGITVRRERLDECQSLWLDLYQRFGLHPDVTVLALTPRRMEGCGGLGWRVPALQALREATGSPLRYHGGIAHSVIPDYSAGSDWGRVAVMAMEVYHAVLDRRHASNFHNERSGCFLTDADGGSLVDFLDDLVGLGLDTSCFKPAVHPHGTIGSYPASTVRIGRPGDVTGTLAGARVWGNLGGMGVRIERDGGSFRLTLYDPCPTGRINRRDPRRVIDHRIDSVEGYRCTLEDAERSMPHDIMSYGEPEQFRWYTIQQVPGVKNAREGY